jgi:hypothetical protein
VNSVCEYLNAYAKICLMEIFHVFGDIWEMYELCSLGRFRGKCMKGVMLKGYPNIVDGPLIVVD